MLQAIWCTKDNPLLNSLPVEVREHMLTLKTDDERMYYLEQELLKIVEKPIGKFVMHAKRVRGKQVFWIEKTTNAS
jgi:hypothetical protein